MPRLAPTAASVALTLILAGCAAGEADPAALGEDAEASGGSEPMAPGECQPSGPDVESLEVSTDLDAPPEITFSSALTPAATERMVVVEGEGEQVEAQDRVTLSYAYFNGETGEKIGHIGYEDEAPDMIPIEPDTPYLVGLVHTLMCSTVGSRVAGVIPAEEAFGTEGAPEFGLGAGVSIIFIADILDIQPPPPPPLEELVGTQQPAPEGFPAVELVDGVPVVEFPEGDIPGSYAVASVIEGEGPMVYDGATVVVHYHGVNWNTGETFDSSFERGEPATFPTNGVIPGFRDGLVGQDVGSRVLITIPPALGYGPQGGTGDGRIGPEDTIFFVVDILGMQ
ncbi:peptidylprolyl isomerase [Pontimonas salivibrio]|uniref:peptidylprolyl isomerase n=1 Tax=Pontimonas salivibrio TaxID=1159327 RepID=A0A2L2BRQ4_9MICO|nr:FKBP-type peptidyl-prolyl cis-trans isomerase [Pontimonas salivibrio]AVG24355.1 peptidylprolyl isomerase [Pontimonas salivibrio]